MARRSWPARCRRKNSSSLPLIRLTGVVSRLGLCNTAAAGVHAAKRFQGLPGQAAKKMVVVEVIARPDLADEGPAERHYIGGKDDGANDSLVALPDDFIFCCLLVDEGDHDAGEEREELRDEGE